MATSWTKMIQDIWVEEKEFIHFLNNLLKLKKLVDFYDLTMV